MYVYKCIDFHLIKSDNCNGCWEQPSNAIELHFFKHKIPTNSNENNNKRTRNGYVANNKEYHTNVACNN